VPDKNDAIFATYLCNGRDFFALVAVIDYDQNPEMENTKKSIMNLLEKMKT
jgi:hypothetical protein